MARISCRMEARSTQTSALHVAPEIQPAAIIPAHRQRQPLLPIQPRSLRGALRDESFAAVYFTAGGDHAPDGRHLVGGIRSVPAASGFRFTAGRLPHDTSTNVLSGCQPRRDGFLGYCAAGTAIRGNPRAE